MKFAYLLFIALFGIVARGTGQEITINEFRIHVNPEDFRMADEGMYLMTESFGEIALNNLRFDEKGYYSACHISSMCKNCMKEFEVYPNTCDQCGSKELDIIAIPQEEDNGYLTVQAALCAFLNNFSIWKGETLICGEITIEAEADSDGNTSVSGSIGDSSNDGSSSWEVTGKGNRDEEGNISGSISVSATFTF